MNSGSSRRSSGRNRIYHAWVRCPIAIALTILRIVTLFLINETRAIGILYDRS
ncbi:MAG: hypothetical protein LH628_28080 [Microcoleus sp. CAN_BIN18]|nr:hypothetical protein [Microcoleus sp. CAN_BIN18]